MLQRNHCEAVIDEFQMLFRTQRRLSDGNLYFVFMMRKLGQMKNLMDSLYIITLRNVTNVNEIYDLEMDMGLARKIFKKTSEEQNPNDLIIYERNKEEFQKILMFLDINSEGDFKLDIARLKKYQN